MASSIFLATSHAGSSDQIFLNGPGGQPYTGSGTPWTVQGTSPYRLAMNDATGPRWTLAAADSGMVFGGGAPFMLGGAAPLYTATGDVTETIPLQVYANTLDRAIFLVRQLQYILAGIGDATWSVLLGMKPDTTTNTAYFEIKAGFVQETPHFINDELGRKCIRANMTIVRAPYALPSSLTTLINNAVFTNVGTGANNNTQSLGINTFSGTTTDGDRTLSGQPMNLKLANGTTSAAYRIWLATVLERVYTSVNVAKTTSTAADWALSAANVTLSGSLYYRTGIKGRLLARFKTLTNLSKMVFEATIYDNSGSTAGMQLLPTKQLMYPDGPSATAVFIDFGWFDLSLLRRNQLGTTAPKISVNFRLLSSDGTSVTATLDYFEVLEYWDFCRIDPASSGIFTVSSSFTMYVETVQNLNQTAYIPTRPPLAYFTAAANDQPVDPRLVRGRLPRARQGGSLYVAWVDSSYSHDSTNTIRITVQNAPQFATYRGAG